MNHFTRLGPFAREGKEGLFFYFLLREDGDPLLVGRESLEASARQVMEQFLVAVVEGGAPSQWTLVVRWEAPPADVQELARTFTGAFGVDALPAPSVTRNSIRPVRPEELELLTDALEAACALWAPGSVPQAKAGVKLTPV